MGSPPRVIRVWGESYDQLAGTTYPQKPLIQGPYYLNAIPNPGDGIRLCVFFNPWGGVEAARFPNVLTGEDWDQIYPEPIDQIDWLQTGGFSVFAQRYWEARRPVTHGFDEWMHKGIDVPNGSDGQSRISAGFVTIGINNYDDHAIYWSFNPNPPPPGIGRDGYYTGSQKMGNGLSGTMPGLYVQQPGDLQILVLAHLNLLNDGNIQTTQHGGPQDVGWEYHGINRPHRFFYADQPRQWGTVMSVWSKNFNDYIGYTGDIPWRTSLRDPDYQIQSMILTIRAKPIGVYGGMFA